MREIIPHHAPDLDGVDFEAFGIVAIKAMSGTRTIGEWRSSTKKVLTGDGASTPKAAQRCPALARRSPRVAPMLASAALCALRQHIMRSHTEG
ncbi:hypothetical protein AOQ73_26755 [Bradyrhizobium pachyrhizi]|nr:hypothetical protein AOQ73_26755 [Bradyrhizobium pachyrhizi]